MHVSARQRTLVYRVSFIMLTMLIHAGCGPHKTQTPLVPNTLPPAQEIEYAYQNEEAKPTAAVPETTTQNNIRYQPLPNKIINKSNVEIIIGDTKVLNTKVSYDPTDRKMTLTGQVIIKTNSKEKEIEKIIELSGTHAKNQSVFILQNNTSHDSQTTEKKIIVSAQANCLSKLDENDINCNHVLVDIYVLYNNKYYTEQIELNRATLKAPKTVPQPAVPAPIPLQNENEDQIDMQQYEESDDSLDGRYQGGAQTIDLDQLFPKDNLTPAPAEPVKPKDSPLTPTVPTITAPPLPKDKPLTSDLQQNKNGEIRPINQAFGLPEAGHLRNATSLLNRQQALNKKSFFEVVVPQRKKYFATYEMAEIITRVGEQLNKQYTKKLYISNLSALNGGPLEPHTSHQNGLDADLAYPTDIASFKFPLVVRMKTQEYYPKNYSVEKTYNLFKFLFMQKDIVVDRIFVDQIIKEALCRHAISQYELGRENKASIREMFENIQHVTGHGDHFHLRIKCSKLDPGCRSRIYKKMQSCELP